MPKKVQTIAITNFGGRLTRVVNGDLNSGFAKFATSWGYDPFSKPGNLQWNYDTSSIAQVSSTALAGVNYKGPLMSFIDRAGQYYIMGNNAGGVVNDNYSIDPLSDSIIGIYNMSSIFGTFNYGAGVEQFGTEGNVVYSSDNTIVTVDQHPNDFPVLVSAFNSVTGNASSVTAGLPHPLKEFQGDLYYGNGNNIGRIENIGTFGTITNGAVLNPALPEGLVITDLDVTPEGDYLIITGSFSPPPWLGNVSTYISDSNKRAAAGQSFIFYWNGSDEAVTAIRTLPSFPAPSFETFLDTQYTVMQDTFGMALMEGNKKLLTLPNNVNPNSNALAANGTFLTWVCVEGIGGVGEGTNRYSSVVGSLYYFGKLDEENPAGLWRMNRTYPIGQRSIQYAPYNQVVGNFSSYVNLVQSYGRHFYSTQELVFPDNTSSVMSRFHRFVLNPGEVTQPTQGTYETQTQLFSKRISVAQVRVYCEPTVANNSFRLDLIGADGDPIEGGTFTYRYGDIVDPQTNSPSVERINFQGNIKSQYSLGVRITNTGTTNMLINKIEIDISEEGK